MLYGVPKLVIRHKIEDLNKMTKRENMKKSSSRSNGDKTPPTLKVKTSMNEKTSVPKKHEEDDISFPKSNLMMMLDKSQVKTPKRVNVKWKNSPNLISLKKGLEKHGKNWNAILQDKTLNLPNVTADSLKRAYERHLRSPKKKKQKTTTSPKRTKQRVATPLPPALRPSRYVVACYQQKGLKDELIVTTNIAASFAHAGKKTCLISANPKNPTVDMQKKRIAAREHHLKMQQLRRTKNTTSWLKSGIDVEEEDLTKTITTTTSDSMWPQDTIPDMSTLKFDLKRTESSEKASPPTLASYLSASMKGSEEASSWLKENVSKFEDLESVYYKNGMFQAPLQILHAGDTLYEINASFTDRQDHDEVLCYFTRLFDYLLSENGGFERVVVSMGTL